MKQFNKYISVIFIIFIFTGCGTFNANERGLLQHNGDSVLIPYNSYISGKQQENIINELNLNGIYSCKVGDYVWMEMNWRDTVLKSVVMKNPPQSEFAKVLAQGINNNLAGCVTPLTYEEYQYYKNQQPSTLSNIANVLNNFNQGMNSIK